MNVGDVIVRKSDTLIAELAHWCKMDKIVKIERMMYHLESGNVFPKDVLENVYSLLDDEFEVVVPDKTTSQ